MDSLSSMISADGGGIPMGIQSPMQQAAAVAQARSAMDAQQITANNATLSNISTQDTLATRKALAANTTTDPTTGQMSVDYPGTLKALAAVSPSAALSFQQAQQERIATIQEKQATLQATQLANQQSKINLIGSVMQHVKDSPDPQAALDNLNIVAKQNPDLYGNMSIPQTYDPAKMSQFVDQAQKVSEANNQKIETNRLGLTATKQSADIAQMANSAVNEVAGQYKDDPNTKEYVQMSNTYTSFKAMQSTKDFATGLKDRDLVYNFQNIINPQRSATGSTTEQDEEARSILQGWGVDANKVVGGDQLSASQRQQIGAFIETKWQQSTMKQQAVFNQYQNRLINMAAKGQSVDPYHALPAYGDVIQNTPKSAVDHSSDVSSAAPGIQIDGTAPPVNASALSPSAGNPAAGTPNPMPPSAPALASGPVISKASIDARAERTGENPADIVAAIRAKGGRIEGE